MTDIPRRTLTLNRNTTAHDRPAPQQTRREPGTAAPQSAVASTAPIARTHGRGGGMDSILDPVRGHFNLDDDASATLAAFARKLMDGGKPRRTG